ncbi:hypothetical protein H744_1c0461 [Photobacterium gaetbulicola Gung47]|uniref:Uncharacterized protein n=1 Tax=Photobacterium gaetbulicola Gung47 TaxID=658445 RepID=A0A0C5W262_9GAMM|nr:hypothetical protein H744_1c0461 [Photobacterium gaetbulicola Gung47]
MEIYAKFIGGGPARRGYIDESRRWFFENDSCVIRDLAPYILSPLVTLLGAPGNLKWYRNSYTPVIPVVPSGEVTPKYGSSATGIGTLGEAIVNVSVSYRPYTKDVVSELTLVGSKSQHTFNLEDKVVNGEHPETTCIIALDMVNNAVQSQEFRQQNIEQTFSTLRLIYGAI